MRKPNDKGRTSEIEVAYCANQRSLSSFLRRFLDSPEDIEDAMQQAFLKAYQAERSTKIKAPRAFLFRTARNLALNELAKRRNRKTETVADFDPYTVFVHQHSQEELCIVRERLEQALDLISELPPRAREVFVLRKVHGLTQREIAARMGIAESTVEKHIAKGLRLVARRDGPVLKSSAAQPVDEVEPTRVRKP